MIARTVQKILGAAVLAASVVLAPGASLAQGTMQQVSPVVPGHTITSVQNGYFIDGGAALGGPPGIGLSELLLQSVRNGVVPSSANGFGQGPFQNTGTGQFGTHHCEYAGSPKSPAGSYYLCMDPDTIEDGTAGGLITFGSIGIAPTLPLQICANGFCAQFPFTGTGAGSGNVTGVPPTIIGGGACFTNTTATGIGECSPSTPGAPTIAAVTPTVVDTPVCWDNTTGTLLITCPGSGSAGPFQVETTNSSGIPSFTSFLTLPQIASLATSPTGNPTGGSLLTTLSTVAVQAAASSATNREFLVNLGMTSNAGNGASGSNGDKVTLYSGMVASAGSGPAWATNFLTSRQTGAGNYDLQTEECDQNNFGVDTGGSDGPGGLPTFISYCVSASGVSDANGFTNTAGLAVISFGGNSGTVPLDAHGEVFAGFYKFNDIADYASAPTYEAIFGTHTYGIDFAQAGLSAGAVRIGGNSTAGIIGRNSANTADAQLLTWSGANELLCQTNCSEVSSAAPVLAPSFAAATGITIASLPVPTGTGTANTCALWLTSGNLGTTPCAASTADNVTIVNNSGVFTAVAVGLPPIAATASTTSTTLTPGQSGIIDVLMTSNSAFTISAPSPSSDGRLLKLVLTQDGTGSRLATFTNVLFGSTISGFTASTGAGLTDYVGLQWSATAGKWVMLAFALGYTL